MCLTAGLQPHQPWLWTPPCLTYNASQLSHVRDQIQGQVLFLNLMVIYGIPIGFISESHLVMSNSLRPHGLYSQWNSPGQNTGVGSCFFLQGIFPTQEWNWGLPHCRRILYQLSHQGHMAACLERNAEPRGWCLGAGLAGTYIHTMNPPQKAQALLGQTAHEKQRSYWYLQRESKQKQSELGEASSWKTRLVIWGEKNRKH